jgi:hypothetical protein
MVSPGIGILDSSPGGSGGMRKGPEGLPIFTAAGPASPGKAFGLDL